MLENTELWNTDFFKLLYFYCNPLFFCLFYFFFFACFSLFLFKFSYEYLFFPIPRPWHWRRWNHTELVTFFRSLVCTFLFFKKSLLNVWLFECWTIALNQHNAKKRGSDRWDKNQITKEIMNETLCGLNRKWLIMKVQVRSLDISIIKALKNSFHFNLLLFLHMDVLLHFHYL